MKDEQAEVLIAGGGPVGLGLAIELGQRGIRTRVFERYIEPQPVPKGQNLTQRTMEHFHFWGAEEQLRQARTIPPEYGIGGLTAYGTLLSGHHYDWLQREQVRPYYFKDNERLPQYATERVLRARLAELGCVTVHYGLSVEDFVQDRTGVTVTALDRESGTRHRFLGQYLVGCDGSRSVVRDKAGITQTRTDHDRLMALIVFRSTGLDKLLQRFPGKSYYNVLHPDLEGYWQFFGRVDLDALFFFHAPVPASAREDGYDFTAYLYRAVGDMFDVELEYIGYWDLRFALADDYRAGRVLIAGDAAHSHPPYGGYGINTGFEDARNLGWKLAALLKGWGGSALLDSYSAERKAVFASTARDFIARSIDTDRDFLAHFDPSRDAVGFEAEWGARATMAIGEVATFEPHYRGSPIVFGPDDVESGAVGSHQFPAEAGRHLAPREMANGINTYDTLGSDFTLFAFDADAQDVAALTDAAERHEIPLTLVRDNETGDQRLYDSRLILVRPDQFVAWCGDSLDILDADIIMTHAIGQIRPPS